MTVLIMIGGLLPGDFVEAVNYPNSNVEMRTGDILVGTPINFTSYSILRNLFADEVCHCAIIHDSGASQAVVEITVPGFPMRKSIDKWSEQNVNISVLRLKSDPNGIGDKVGQWANKYVNDYPNAWYEITNSLLTYDKTYSAKLVWQAFFENGIKLTNINPNEGYVLPIEFLQNSNLDYELKYNLDNPIFDPGNKFSFYQAYDTVQTGI